uniref:UDP-glucuronosyltransferase n=1 Tax=Angiostrongylus costaricensis TaxID=334426 RepID=A0A0R3PQD4_ANGCS
LFVETRLISEVVENKEFLNWLLLQKFDLAFTHIFDVCPIGLVHYAKIPSWIWLSSTDDGEQRSDEFRGKSEEFRWTYVDYRFLEKVMVNSNELYEAPRPTLSKIVNIGGVGIGFKDANPLPDEFQRIIDVCVGLVVFSFGSVTPSYKMPLAWKKAFLAAFKNYPEHHFVMKYEGTDLQDHLPSNVHVFKWLPQANLLAHPKTKALISHGGYNSLQEAIIAGVPLITIPLFGDQPKNAKLAEKHRIAVNLRKDNLTVDAVVKALEKLLSDRRLD